MMLARETLCNLASVLMLAPPANCFAIYWRCASLVFIDRPSAMPAADARSRFPSCSTITSTCRTATDLIVAPTSCALRPSLSGFDTPKVLPSAICSSSPGSHRIYRDKLRCAPVI